MPPPFCRLTFPVWRSMWRKRSAAGSACSASIAACARTAARSMSARRSGGKRGSGGAPSSSAAGRVPNVYPRGGERRGRFPTVGVILHAPDRDAHRARRRLAHRVADRRPVDPAEHRDRVRGDGVGRLVRPGAVEHLDMTVFPVRDRLRHHQIRVAPQRGQPRHLRGDVERRAEARPVDAHDEAPPVGRDQAIDPVLRDRQRRERGDGQVVGGQRAAGDPREEPRARRLVARDPEIRLRLGLRLRGGHQRVRSTRSQRLPYRSSNTATVPYASARGGSTKRTPRAVNAA
jgi:hypothetical protein